MKYKFGCLLLAFCLFFSSFALGCNSIIENTAAGNSSALQSDNDTTYSSDDSSSYDDTAPSGNNSSDSVSSGNSSRPNDDYGVSSIPTSSSQSTYTDYVFSFPYMTAEDDGLLDANPDRGFRTEMVLYIEESVDADDDPRTAYVHQSEKEIREDLEFVFNIYFKKNVTPDDKLFLAYIYITDFRDDPISKAEPVLRIFFEMCRERKVKSMLRFCYNNDYAINFTLSLANKVKLASQCANQETILRHINELAPYIAEYSDTIHTISSGFIGFVGEWAYHYQYPEVDYPTVLKAIVEKLCVPNGLYFSARMPEYKAQVGDDYKYKDYISYNNDAMYGEQTNEGWNSANYQMGQSNGWWEYVTKVAAYTPQDGEMYTNDVLVNWNIWPKGWDVIKECAHHRHTSMSNWHGYIEALRRDNIIQKWIDNERVTTTELHRLKILYDPSWFLDENGNNVKRNPYEFLKDHLGYRLSLYQGHVKGDIKKGSTVDFEITLKNYGFAAPYMLQSGFAILDENYNVVYSEKAGEPSTWYSHAPDNSNTGTPLSHTVKTKLKLPDKSGKYYVSFYLKNTMNDYARLANKMSFKNGQNLLFAFTV